MIRGLLFCATICSIATPAIADDRENATTPLIVPDLIVVTRDHDLAGGKSLAIVSDFTVTVRSAKPAPVTLADFDALSPPAPVLIEQAPSDLPVSTIQMSVVRRWPVGDRLPLVTSSAGGNYAVSDVLGQFRKPRFYRRTALSTMLVLKLDGKDDTDSFSVGGGGVASALWKASQ